jgi:predicted transcriptional regulator of viral defense system
MIYQTRLISRQDKFREFANQVGQVFSVDKAAKQLKSDPKKTAKKLARWHNQGLITRISRGLYALIPLDIPSVNFTLEDPWMLLPQLFAPGYMGGWTAAEHWDLTEQLFNTLMIFTTCSIASKEMTIGQQKFELKHIQTSCLFGLKTVWRGREKIMISDVHRTIVDFFNDLETAGGLQHAIDCLKKYLQKPEAKANLNILAEYVAKMNNGALYKRLGYLLEQLIGADHPLIKDFRDKLTKGYAYLDPKQKNEVYLVKRWHLFVPKTLKFEG